MGVQAASATELVGMLLETEQNARTLAREAETCAHMPSIGLKGLDGWAPAGMLKAAALESSRILGELVALLEAADDPLGQKLREELTPLLARRTAAITEITRQKPSAGGYNTIRWHVEQAVPVLQQLVQELQLRAAAAGIGRLCRWFGGVT